jgi:hypothetical protein
VPPLPVVSAVALVVPPTLLVCAVESSLALVTEAPPPTPPTEPWVVALVDPFTVDEAPPTPEVAVLALLPSVVELALPTEAPVVLAVLGPVAPRSSVPAGVESDEQAATATTSEVNAACAACRNRGMPRRPRAWQRGPTDATSNLEALPTLTRLQHRGKNAIRELVCSLYQVAFWRNLGPGRDQFRWRWECAAAQPRSVVRETDG